MSVALNHTIVWCRDKQRSAHYLTEILGLDAPVAFGLFLVVELGNGVSMDYHDGVGDDITSQHYAFLVSDDEFDAIHGRIVERGQDHWQDPGCSAPGVNHHWGGRGTYFLDPDEHVLEIITRPYGSAPR